ncbi:hypothetical protein AB4072_11925 [Microvirga sp. 2MCAF38]|uniref:hypothetical protein n=1 Tax=Microvirga sp. 2MCAF38 TaxID=3232989 RepID=UPI003F9AC5B5
MENSKQVAEVFRVGSLLSKSYWRRGRNPRAIADLFSRRVLLLAFVLFNILVWTLIVIALS